MPWTQRQWSAMAADYVRRYGKKKGREKLHALKVKHGGNVIKKGS